MQYAYRELRLLCLFIRIPFNDLKGIVGAFCVQTGKRFVKKENVEVGAKRSCKGYTFLHSS